jgi:pimeloyl-ACP methyl ester carboxylesterase
LHIAIDFTLEHPKMVKALLLVSSGLGGYQLADKAVIDNRTQMVKAWKDGDMEQVAEFFLRSWVDGPHRLPDQVDPKVREQVRAMALERVRCGPSVGERQALQPPAVNRLAEIHVPTLTIVGGLYLPGVLAVSDLLINEIAGAERAIVADAAHMVNMEQPARFNQTVLDFLARANAVKPEYH